ncbi:MAG: tandem-95 repeat protein [Candidatus Zixiibacteriota bacterium]
MHKRLLLLTGLLTVIVATAAAQTAPPVLNPIGARAIDEGLTLTFNDTATDLDGTTPVMSTSALPPNASFVNNLNGTGTFTFNPDFTQAGTIIITFYATDAVTTDVDSEQVTITVNNVNQAPVLATIGPRSVVEGATLNFVVSAADADGTTPSFTTTTPLPTNATFVDNGNGTGTFNFSPSFTQAGVYNITFRASDGTAIDSEIVAVTVTEAGNQTPILAAIGARSVAENATLNFNVSATDPDGTTPIMTTSTPLPANATFIDNGNGTGTFNFTPDFTQAGVYNITFRASDGTAIDSEIVAITVTEAGNQAPVLATIGPRSVVEGANLNFSISATDADGTIPILSTSTPLPANATFVDNGNGTGTFNFNPDFTQAGTINVTFYASDGAIIDSEQVAITVNNVNQAPVLAAIGPRAVNEGANLNFGVSASDPDGTAPILTTTTPLPINATFIDNGNGTGTFNFNPDFTQAGTFNVTFYASDGSIIDSEQVVITVNNVNQAPVLATIGPRSVNEGTNLNFAVSATDADGTTPILTTTTPLPANATFTDNLNGTGTFNFNPDFAQAGTFNVTFYASDGSIIDSEQVVITVNNVNQAPVLATIGPRSVNEGANLNFAVSATDADGTTPLLTTTTPLPTNATFVDNGNGTGTFNFTPDFTQAGTVNVTFYASDGSIIDSEQVIITVNNVNQAPVLAAIGPRSVNEGSNLNFGVSASDPDGTTPILTTTTPLPANATFVDNGNGTGTFNFNPDFTQAGTFNVTFYASDGSIIDSEQVVITVNNVNQAPVLAAIGPRIVNEGANLNIGISATDADGTTPLLTTTTPLPTNATFVDNGNGTGTFNFNPDFTQAGTVNVTFYASDGSIIDSEQVVITVNNVNQAPVLATIGPRSVNEGSNLNFGVSASDPDGTTPILTTTTPLPANATFIDNGNGTGTFNFSPDFTQAGVYTITFYASDGSITDSEVVTVTVGGVNQLPVLASIGPRSVNEGANLNFGVSATDADGTTPALTTTVPLPANATFVDNGNGTGTFNFNPDFTQSGTFNVTFYASDGVAVDSELVVITVNNVNLRPVMTAIGAQAVSEGQVLNLPVSATDPDGTIPALTSSLPLPTNASFVDNLDGTGTFTFSPDFGQAGSYTVTFFASDGALRDSQIVSITVNQVNLPPILAAIGNRSTTEGVNLTFGVSSSDPDGTTPGLTTSTLPAGATFVDNLNGTGTFVWTPTFNRAGSYNVTFYARDDSSAVDSEVVLITVLEAGNQAPVLASIGNKATTEGVNLSFQVSAADPDSTIPAFTTSTLPAGATFVDNGNGTGSFGWTPGFTQAGSYNVTFYASDGLVIDSERISINVFESGNQPPVLAAVGNRSTTEGVNLTFDISATDPDGTTPVLSTSTLPTGATFTNNGNGTGTFNWTPGFTQAGPYNVTFRATDGVATDSEVIVITVFDAGNLAPVLAAIGNKSVTEGVNLSFAISASDPDGTTPTFTTSALPGGASFVDNGNGTGSFTWTPGFTQAGIYNVTFRASDGVLVDTEIVTITVNEAGNQTPVLAAIGNRSVTEGLNLTFNVSATDADGTIPSFTTSTLPSGAIFADNGNGTGTFSWTPGFTQAGPYNVTFRAADGTATDSETIVITVNDAGNQAPVLAIIGNRSTTEGVNLNFVISASDPDGTTPTFTTSTLPSGATFVDNGNGTGTFNWTPDFTQAGLYNVTFRTTDGVATDTERVAITVIDAGNLAPVLAAIGNKSVTEGINLSFGVSATDPDGTTPTFTTSTLPSGATFVDNGNGTGTFSWTPGFTQAGPYNVTFRATDGAAIDSETIVITVNEAGNQAPVLAAIGAKSTSEGANLTFGTLATDPDGTTPIMTSGTLPTGATFVDNGNGTGTFSWTPGFVQAGSYNVTFRAGDGIATDSEIVAITVADAGNQAPVLAAIGSKSTTEGVNLNFVISASDPDGTTPTFTTSALPSGATFVDNGNGTATFNWTPSFIQAGAYNVTFRTTDGVAIDTETVAITVIDAGNQPPVLATIGSKTTTEGINLAFAISASDPDGTTPTFTTSTLPSGASFADNGNGTGSFIWTPGFTQAGTYNVTFRASDGLLVDSEVVAITVLDAGNQLPVLASIGAKSTTEGVNLTFGTAATDPDGTTPIMSTGTLPTGATFVDNGDGTGTFNWTPSFTQSGGYNVVFRASDGSLTDSEIVSINVLEAGNRAPIIAPVGPQSITEGLTLAFGVIASDPDGTTPVLTSSTLPRGASFVDAGNGTGSFTWSPDFVQSGTYNVSFFATDGVLRDTEAIVITVIDAGNQPPVLAAIGSRSTTEGVILSFGISATDAEGGSPTLTTGTLPSGASFVDNNNGTGTFSWVPVFNQAGVYSITFRATDDSLAVDSEVVSITVIDAGNQAPLLAAVGNRTTSENVLLAFGITAVDPDSTIPALTTSTLPTGATFVDNGNGSGNFSWTPSFIQAGSYPVTFYASDGVAVDSERIVITVTEAGNQSPVLATIGARSTTEGIRLTFNVSATDPDATIPSFSTSVLPSGASFVDNGNGSGTFDWTPTFIQAGSYSIVFRATDGALTDSEVVSVTVIEAGNQAPILATIGPKSVYENRNLNVVVTASDPDATTPALTTSSLPLGATFVDNLNGTGTFNWTPGFTQAASYVVTFYASDGSLRDSEVVIISVLNADAPPVLAPIGSKSVAEAANLNFNVSATDIDGTIAVLTATPLPVGATFVDNLNGTGVFNWTPTLAQSGVYSVTFFATDDSAAVDSEVVQITVGNVNQPPVLATIGPKTVDENVNLAFGVTATDGDGNIPALTTSTLPTGATFLDNGDGSGAFSWTPTFAQAGTYPVTFYASDGVDTDSELVVITVNQVNLPPVLAAVGAKSVNENANLNFAVSASDPDATFPVLTTTALPLGATFADNGNGTGSFNWTPNFTQSGAYSVTFYASDGQYVDSEVVAITVGNTNRLPVANAGADQIDVFVNSTVLLDGTASFDPDAQAITYGWTQVSGPLVTLNSSSTATPSFVPPLPATYAFELIVSDGSLFSVPDTVQVSAINAAPPQAIADLAIAISADNIVLNWSAITVDTANVPTSIGGYIVYRDTMAYFTPSSFDSIGAVSATTQTFIDNNIFGVNVVGDTLHQYFYVVLAYDIYGNRSAVSNRVGEYDYLIVTTATTSFNLICVPFENSGITTADQLIDAIGRTSVRTVNNYRPTSQSFESRFAAGFGVNFTVIPGGVYQVNAAAATIFSVAGRVPAPGAISYQLVTTATTDYSFLSVPFDRESQFLTAQDVLNNAPGSFNTLNNFVAASQSYQSRFAAGFGVNFPVRAGRPYQANNAINDVFPH